VTVWFIVVAVIVFLVAVIVSLVGLHDSVMVLTIDMTWAAQEQWVRSRHAWTGGIRRTLRRIPHIGRSKGTERTRRRWCRRSRKLVVVRGVAR